MRVPEVILAKDAALQWKDASFIHLQEARDIWKGECRNKRSFLCISDCEHSALEPRALSFPRHAVFALT